MKIMTACIIVIEGHYLKCFALLCLGVFTGKAVYHSTDAISLVGDLSSWES